LCIISIRKSSLAASLALEDQVKKKIHFDVSDEPSHPQVVCVHVVEYEEFNIIVTACKDGCTYVHEAERDLTFDKPSFEHGNILFDSFRFDNSLFSSYMNLFIIYTQYKYYYT
jgi:hypothetical protein